MKMPSSKLIKRFLMTFTPVIVVVILYFAFLNRVNPNEVGLARNHITGETWAQEAGWHVTAPWTWIATVNTNPIRVSVPTTGRGYSSKLVQFVPEHHDEFLELEGWRWYWWDNRFSFNFGHEDEYRGFRNLMLGYAYSAKKYPFIKVLAEYESQE